MENDNFSVYNEGLTWVVSLSAAAAAAWGAFLYYEMLRGGHLFIRWVCFVVVLCFLGTVGVGAWYFFRLYDVRNRLNWRKPPQQDTGLANLHKCLRWLFSAGLFGTAILFSSTLFAAAPTHTEDGSTKQCCEAIAKLSNQLEKLLISIDNTTHHIASSTDVKLDPQLDPQLQQALWQHVQKPAPATDWTWILVVGVLAAVVALIVFIFTNEKDDSRKLLSVAVTIFGTVTAFIVKLAVHKPHLPLGQVPFWIIAVSLAATSAGALLIVEGLFQLRAEKSPLKAASLLVYGFSAILVALVPAMIFSGDDVKTVFQLFGR